MYKCEHYLSVFMMKWNLARHVKTHNGILYSCTVCEKTYNEKSNLGKHMKNVHAILHAPTAQIVQPVTLIAQPERESVIKFAPRIIQPALRDVPTGGSNIMSDDDVCMIDNLFQDIKECLGISHKNNDYRFITDEMIKLREELSKEVKELKLKVEHLEVKLLESI